MSPKSVIDGVLMVGSIPLGSTREVFTKISNTFPGRLPAIPDGEVEERLDWVLTQIHCFPPETISPVYTGLSQPQTGEEKYSLDSIKATGYDDAAIASYAELQELKRQGIVPSDLRLQVCLPTPYNTIQSLCKTHLRAELEPFYETRLIESIERMTQSIPHHDLVIQWDMPLEIAATEYERGELKNDMFGPWFTPLRAGVIERLTRLCKHIPANVAVAFHLCYGDYQHQHWFEPHDTAVLVSMANDLIEAVSATHKVDWVHMPVPRSRADTAYYQPLNELRLGDTRLYLGLVHANDEAGTRERISVAQSVYPHSFGVATECGLGRTPRVEVDSILAISKAVSGPSE